MWINKQRRRIVGGFVSLLLASGPVAAAEQAFKVCADPNNLPFSDQKSQGFENKLAELFAKELGQKLEYTWFPQRLGFIRNTLKAKPEGSEEYKCDVVMGVPQGYELAATTQPYYRSTYALVYAKGKGYDLKSPADLDKFPAEQKSKLKFAMFDGAPGTTWLLNHGLVGQGIPYQTMTGDVSVSTAQVLDQDLRAGKIDMVIIWGPIAGYLLAKNPGLEMLPMKSEPGLKFDFPMSMGVRFPDKARKEQLEGLIKSKAAEIQAILRESRMPLVDEQGNLLP
jgi:mxaJ protein